MSHQPNPVDIDEARNYLLDRLEAELSMQQNLSNYLEQAANRIVEVCNAHNVSSLDDSKVAVEIAVILDWLRDMIQTSCLTLACESESVDDSTEAKSYATRDIAGFDFYDRLDAYTGVFRDEIQDYLTITHETAFPDISARGSRLVAMELAYWSTKWRGFKHKGMSAYNLLNRLTRNTIADTWMHEYLLGAERKGAIGYVIQRGSSYDCETCDELVGFHPISEPMPIPTHANCKCIAIPIYL